VSARSGLHLRRLVGIRAFAGACAGAIALLACLQRRDRLDVPRVSLVLESAVVAPGGLVRGHAWAVDESGVIFFSISVFTDDSLARAQVNRVSSDSVDLVFELGVFSAAPPDAAVVVRAVARDNQDFEVTLTDTVYVTPATPSRGR